MSGLSKDYTHVFWDWNGTLLNDVWLCHAVGNELLRSHALPENELEGYRRLFDFPVVEFYKRVGFDFARESFEELSVRFIAAYEARRHECALYEGCSSVLEAVGAQVRGQAILSAYKQDTLDVIVGEHGLRPYFEAVQGHDNIYAAGKEASARTLVQRLGLADGSSVLVVGDTVHDAEIAAHIGADCLLVSHGHQDEARLRAVGVPVVESLAEVRGWFLGG